MNTIRYKARWVKEENYNEVVPNLAPKHSQLLIEPRATFNVGISQTIHRLTQVLDTQVANYVRVQVKPNASTTTSRIRDFTWMNPTSFFCSKVEEN